MKCIDEEIPFEVPQVWEWCRLREIILGTNAGKSPNCEKRAKKENEWGVLTTTAVQENEFLSNENKVLPQNYIINPEHIVKYGDILITRAGPVNRTGIVCMVDKHCHNLILSDKTVRIEYLRDYSEPTFLVYVLNSSAIHDLVMSTTVGMAASQVNVSQGNIQNTLIPFPPINEQKRIASRLKCLLPLTDKYRNYAEELVLLNKEINNLLKKSILQEAIQGKLVPQIAEEGTAQDLLEQIRLEKQKLVKEGKLKKSALNDSVIFKGDDNRYYEKIGKTVQCIEDDIPFDLPQTWCWCRLCSISSIKGGKRVPVGEKLIVQDTGHKYIRVADMKNHTVKDTDIHYISDSVYAKIKAYTISSKDLYITVAGTIGCVGEIPEAFNNANLTENADKIVICKTNKKYLMYCLLSNSVQSQIKNCTTKVGQPKLAIIRIENLLIPLPPLKEQERIVAQIEKLFEQLH